MADHDVLAEPEPSEQAPFIELEQIDDYSSYLLHSPAEILSVLRSLIQKGALITVYFDQGQSFILTSLIALNPEKGEIVLDLGSNEEMNRRALLTNKLIFTTQIDKVKIQFSLQKLTQTQHEGRAAFRGAMPEALLRLQRREYFRLSTPIANPILLNMTVARGDGSKMSVDLPLLDISGGGIGVMTTPAQASLFQRGDQLDDWRINLPNEGLLSVRLCVRNAFDVTTRTGLRHVRVGCEFVNLPSLRLTMVQRYITRIERERKAKLNGLA